MHRPSYPFAQVDTTLQVDTISPTRRKELEGLVHQVAGIDHPGAAITTLRKHALFKDASGKVRPGNCRLLLPRRVHPTAVAAVNPAILQQHIAQMHS